MVVGEGQWCGTALKNPVTPWHTNADRKWDRFALVEEPQVVSLEPFPGLGRILAFTSVAPLGVVNMTHSLGYDSPKPASAWTFISFYHGQHIDIAPDGTQH